MVENYNSISQNGILKTQQGLTSTPSKPKIDSSGEFKDLLMKSINEVNRLQDEADKATTDLATGKAENVTEVFTAVKKSELAFQTLLQIRNKLMEAYDEIKQIRV